MLAKTHAAKHGVFTLAGNCWTLEELHHILFKAFDREEEHLYEFQFGKRVGKSPPQHADE